MKITANNNHGIESVERPRRSFFLTVSDTVKKTARVALAAILTASSYGALVGIVGTLFVFTANIKFSISAADAFLSSVISGIGGSILGMMSNPVTLFKRYYNLLEKGTMRLPEEVPAASLAATGPSATNPRASIQITVKNPTVKAKKTKPGFLSYKNFAQRVRNRMALQTQTSTSQNVTFQVDVIPQAQA